MAYQVLRGQANGGSTQVTTTREQKPKLYLQMRERGPTLPRQASGSSFEFISQIALGSALSKK